MDDEIKFEDDNKLHPEAAGFCRLSDASLMKLPKREIVSWLRLAIRNLSGTLEIRDAQYRMILDLRKAAGR